MVLDILPSHCRFTPLVGRVQKDPPYTVVMVLKVLAMIAAFWVILAAYPKAADLTAQELAQALQHKYDGIKDFSADFVHKYRGGVLKKEASETGRLLVKRPGKMRWEYKAPEPKLFVSDGLKAYSYIPQDKQVFVSSIPPGDQLSTPAMFLSGKGNLARDFVASLVPPQSGAAPGTRALKLVPKSPQRDYDWLILETASDSLQLRGLVTIDAQGGQSSFSFSNLKENTGLADKEFAFAIPRGVDVITDSPASR
jgi:outer membrane lipoprotein carrier protein